MTAMVLPERCRHATQTAVGSNGHKRQITCSDCDKVLLVLWLGQCQTDLLKRALDHNDRALAEAARPFVTSPARHRWVVATLKALVRMIRWLLGCR